MEVSQIYSLATSAYLALQSLPLLLTPSLIVSMLASDTRRMTELEAYLSRSLALLLLAFAVLTLLLSGTIPATDSWTALTSSATASSDSSASSATSASGASTFAFPTTLITTVYHALTAFYIYMHQTFRRSTSFALSTGITFSAGLFCFGIWVLLFGNEKPHVSKKTGADKRTGNFPFENRESAKEIKKEARREEKEREKEREKEKKESRGNGSSRRSMARGSSWRG